MLPFQETNYKYHQYMSLASETEKTTNALCSYADITCTIKIVLAVTAHVGLCGFMEL